MHHILSFAVVALGLAVLCCDSNHGQEPKGTSGQPAGDQPQTIRLKTFNYVDKEGIGSEAFTVLIPADWKFNGGIKWILDNPGMPAVAQFTITSPSGNERLEVFPNQAFFWTDNQMLLSTFPPGSKYFGSEVRRPSDPTDALASIVIPRFRKDVDNLKIVDKKPLPDLAKSLGVAQQSAPGVSISADGARVRIAYDKNGKSMEEEVFCVVEKMSFTFPSMTGPVTNTNWIVDYVFSFTTEKGALDKNQRMFQTMVESFRLNPQWFNKYSQVVEFLIQQQIQRIQNIGQLSKIISQTHNEISDMIMDSYNQRQAVYDKISTNFSNYTRGVEHYNNPFEGKTVELPNNYSHVWANKSGEYILSNDPNYNPNTTSNKEWQQMEKKE